ncbi:hypothetical protein ACFP81_01265 [Deinococcus lacus]|uniref:Uncharacterized protein n=1 Tax=Deinococcus lacus TaxID=392561 RepID=A0ABW1YBN5_9DEIO
MASLYLILLTLHNWTRWAVLLAGVWALVATLTDRAGAHRASGEAAPAPRPAFRGPVAAFMGSLHLQVLLGLALFALAGMNGAGVFGDGPRSSFQWEHLAIGLLSAVLATLGNRAAKSGAAGRNVAVWVALAWLPLLVMIPWWRPLLRLFGPG